MFQTRLFLTTHNPPRVFDEILRPISLALKWHTDSTLENRNSRLSSFSERKSQRHLPLAAPPPWNSWHSTEMAGTTVVLFDFDHTMIEDNSDTWVVEEMGLTPLFNQLRRSLPWNSLMASIFSLFLIVSRFSFWKTSSIWSVNRLIV